MTETTPKLTLTYFRVSAAAEPLRLAAVIGRIPFTNNPVDFEEWWTPNRGASTPRNQLPMLEIEQHQLAGGVATDGGEVDAKKVVTQSSAILHYLGKLGGLYPKDPRDALQVEAMLDSIAEVLRIIEITEHGACKSMISDTQWSDEELTVIRRRIAKHEEYGLPHYLSYFEQTIERNETRSNWLVGKEITIADLRLYHLLSWISGGIGDGDGPSLLKGVPPRMLKKYPSLKKHKQKIETLPGVVIWRSKYQPILLNRFDFRPPPRREPSRNPKDSNSTTNNNRIWSSHSIMPRLTITYFTSYGRAEHLRLASSIGNVPFTGISIQYPDEWDDSFQKRNAPLGQLPTLEVLEPGVDRLVVPQSSAILRYLGSLGNLYPQEDPSMALEIEFIIDTVAQAIKLMDMTASDAVNALISDTPWTDEDVKIIRKRITENEEFGLPYYLTFFENILEENTGSKWIVGKNLTIADLSLYRLTSWISSGHGGPTDTPLDGIPASIMYDFPNLHIHRKEIDDLPSVVKFRSEFKAPYPNRYDFIPPNSKTDAAVGSMSNSANDMNMRGQDRFSDGVPRAPNRSRQMESVMEENTAPKAPSRGRPSINEGDSEESNEQSITSKPKDGPPGMTIRRPVRSSSPEPAPALIPKFFPTNTPRRQSKGPVADNAAVSAPVTDQSPTIDTETSNIKSGNSDGRKSAQRSRSGNTVSSDPPPARKRFLSEDADNKSTVSNEELSKSRFTMSEIISDIANDNEHKEEAFPALKKEPPKKESKSSKSTDKDSENRSRKSKSKRRDKKGSKSAYKYSNRKDGAYEVGDNNSTSSAGPKKPNRSQSTNNDEVEEDEEGWKSDEDFSSSESEEDLDELLRRTRAEKAKRRARKKESYSDDDSRSSRSSKMSAPPKLSSSRRKDLDDDDSQHSASSKRSAPPKLGSKRVAPPKYPSRLRDMSDESDHSTSSKRSAPPKYPSRLVDRGDESDHSTRSKRSAPPKYPSRIRDREYESDQSTSSKRSAPPKYPSRLGDRGDDSDHSTSSKRSAPPKYPSRLGDRGDGNESDRSTSSKRSAPPRYPSRLDDRGDGNESDRSTSSKRSAPPKYPSRLCDRGDGNESDRSTSSKRSAPPKYPSRLGDAGDGNESDRSTSSKRSAPPKYPSRLGGGGDGNESDRSSSSKRSAPPKYPSRLQDRDDDSIHSTSSKRSAPPKFPSRLGERGDGSESDCSTNSKRSAPPKFPSRQRYKDDDNASVHSTSSKRSAPPKFPSRLRDRDNNSEFSKKSTYDDPPNNSNSIRQEEKSDENIRNTPPKILSSSHREERSDHSRSSTRSAPPKYPSRLGDSENSDHSRSSTRNASSSSKRSNPPRYPSRLGEDERSVSSSSSQRSAPPKYPSRLGDDDRSVTSTNSRNAPPKVPSRAGDMSDNSERSTSSKRSAPPKYPSRLRDRDEESVHSTSSKRNAPPKYPSRLGQDDEESINSTSSKRSAPPKYPSRLGNTETLNHAKSSSSDGTPKVPSGNVEEEANSSATIKRKVPKFPSRQHSDGEESIASSSSKRRNSSGRSRESHADDNRSVTSTNSKKSAPRYPVRRRESDGDSSISSICSKKDAPRLPGRPKESNDTGEEYSKITSEDNSNIHGNGNDKDINAKRPTRRRASNDYDKSGAPKNPTRCGFDKSDDDQVSSKDKKRREHKKTPARTRSKSMPKYKPPHDEMESEDERSCESDSAPRFSASAFLEDESSDGTEDSEFSRDNILYIKKKKRNGIPKFNKSSKPRVQSGSKYAARTDTKPELSKTSKESKSRKKSSYNRASSMDTPADGDSNDEDASVASTVASAPPQRSKKDKKEKKIKKDSVPEPPTISDTRKKKKSPKAKGKKMLKLPKNAPRGLPKNTPRVQGLKVGQANGSSISGSAASVGITLTIPKLSLTYFEISGRAEIIRFAAAIGNIPFKNVCVGFDTWWSTEKFKTPLGQLPLLEIEEGGRGAKVVPQSHAIFRYMGMLGDLYPSDPLESLIVDSVVDIVSEAFKSVETSASASAETMLSDFPWTNDDLATNRKRISKKEDICNYLSHLEGILKDNKGKGQWFANGKLSIADLAVYNLIWWLENGIGNGMRAGVLGNIPSNIVGGYTLLSVFKRMFSGNSGLNEWRSKLNSPYKTFDFCPSVPRSTYSVDLGKPALGIQKFTLTSCSNSTRAESIRLACAIGNIAFTNKIIKADEWIKLCKRKDRVGQVPLLEIDEPGKDKRYIAQSSAILRYFGKLGGLYPREPMQVIQVESIMATVVEALKCIEIGITGSIQSMILYGHTDWTEAELKALGSVIAGSDTVGIPHYLKYFEKTLKESQHGWFAGKKITIADLRVYHLICWIIERKGLNLDGVNLNLDRYPSLKSHKNRIEEIPQVKTWLLKYKTLNKTSEFRPY